MISGSKIYKPYDDGILEEDMEKYAGEYILIEGDFQSPKGKIIGHNKSLFELMKKSEKYHNKRVYITYSFPEHE